VSFTLPPPCPKGKTGGEAVSVRLSGQREGPDGWRTGWGYGDRKQPHGVKESNASEEDGRILFSVTSMRIA